MTQKTPTKLKKISGNPGKRKINDKEPIPTGALVMPTGMTPNAIDVWTRITAAQVEGVYTSADVYIIRALVESIVTFQDATDTLTLEGRFSTGVAGQTIQHPAVRIQSDNARLIATLSARLGLDPVSRQSLAIGGKTSGPNIAGGFEGLIQ